MRLYHFTTPEAARKIAENGLRIGTVRENDDTGLSLHGGWPWLTEDARPQEQAWARAVPYKTQVRITFDIPHYATGRLYDRKRLCKRYHAAWRMYHQYDGADSWYTFRGVVPPSWIKCVDTRG